MLKGVEFVAVMVLISALYFVITFLTAALESHACEHGNLYDLWNTYEKGPVIDKWSGYASAYDDNLCKFHTLSDLSILEIGVQSGGSLNLWKQYFKNLHKVVGVDINSLCSQVHNPDAGIYVEIGSQSNATFLNEVCDRYGPFQIIIDDGSHRTSDMIISLRTLFPSCLADGGTYVLEDTCVMAFFDQDDTIHEGKDLSSHIADIYRSIHHYWSPDSKSYDSVFSEHVHRLSMYDGVIFIEKKQQTQLHRIVRGDWRVPNARTEVLQFFDPLDAAPMLSYEVDVGENSENAINNRLRPIYTELKELCEKYNLHQYVASDTKSCAANLLQHVLERSYRTQWIIDDKFYDGL